MKNRPTEPGHYWWVDDFGKNHVAEFNARMTTEWDLCGNGELEECDVNEFESETVDRWIGPAHPPKHFEVIRMTSCYHNLAFPSDEDMWVHFNDVKEYQLEDE